MTGIMMYSMSHKLASGPALVYNLDAANYAAVPANGSTVLGTGNYTISASYTQGRITYNSANGGVFRSNFGGDGIGDYIIGGPALADGTSYTVFMAYKLNTASATGGTTANYGRLLNSNNLAGQDWLMGGYSGRPNAYFTTGGSINLTGSAADLVWHLDWAVFNKTTNTAYLYSATTAQPTTHLYTLSSSAVTAFNQLRMFSKGDGNECAPADIGVVKVWTGALTLAQIQAEWTNYHTRFGY